MKTTILYRYLIILSVVSGVLFSCSKKDIAPTPAQTAENNPVLNYIKKLGYNESQIRDLGDEYLVDEDILFSKTGTPDLSVFDAPKTEQYGTANYVGYNVQPNILVYVDPSMSGYQSEINSAINIWNSVANCRVKFNLTTSSAGAHIRIVNSNLGTGVCGAAYFPVNGQPGSLVRININQISGNSFEQRTRTIAHELGHCIGFRHTNWQSGEGRSGTLPDNGAYYDAIHILGTPTGGDASSLMNAGQCGIGATVLSNYDILAVQFLYPAQAPVAGSVPVFRYYSRFTNQDYFYTIDINELGNGSNGGYIFEGIAFYAFSSQVANSSPVYRWLRSGNDHFWTISATEIPGSSTLEGVAFYAYTSPINNSVPVIRYFSPSYGDHFYTKNPNELSSIPGYNQEGVAWYAY